MTARLMAMAALNALRHKVEENPADYDAHVELIRALRAAGDADDLEAARETFREHFPLPPELWEEWLNDTLEPLGNTERALELISLALMDYASPRLAARRCELLAEEGGADVGEAFQAALLSPASLDFVEGHLLWDSYRSYIGDDTDELRDAFRMQLTIPSARRGELLETYRGWEEDDEEAQITFTAAAQAIDHQKTCERLEGELARCAPGSADRVLRWKRYSGLAAKGEVGRADRMSRAVLERAVRDCPLAVELWLVLAHKIRESKTVPEDERAEETRLVLERAVRNCPFSGEAWSALLHQVFQRAVRQTLQTSRQYAHLYLSFLSSLRRARRLDLPRPALPEVEPLVVAALSFFPPLGDFVSLASVVEAWGDVLRDEDAGAEAETAWFQKQLARREKEEKVYPAAACGRWLRRVKPEGWLADCVQCFRTAVWQATTQAQAEMFVDELMSTEGAFGSVDSFEAAEMNCRKRMSLFTAVQSAPKREREEDSGAPPLCKKRRKGQGEEGGDKSNSKSKNRDHRDAGSTEDRADMGEAKTEGKKKKRELAGPGNEEMTVFCWSLPFDADESILRAELFGDCDIAKGGLRLIKTGGGRSKGYAYVELGDQESIALALSRDRTVIMGRQVRIQMSGHGKTKRAGTGEKQAAPQEPGTTGGGRGRRAAPAMMRHRRGGFGFGGRGRFGEAPAMTNDFFRQMVSGGKPAAPAAPDTGSGEG